jgi:ribulose-phosphate 3-epimerase
MGGKMKTYKIAASILSADFARLGEEVQSVLDAGADILHFDAMDNHFVPNLTIGPVVCASLRKYEINSNINVHLMTKPVDRLIVEFAKAGATSIVFHPEATDNMEHSLTLIRENGCQAGIALNPTIPVTCLEKIIKQVDMVLVMSVSPGFPGQEFIPETFQKISQVRKLIDIQKRSISLAVDGGIKISNIAEVANAGADILVIGSAIFNNGDYAKTVKVMRERLAAV